jgi:hypothetical protein
VLPLGEVLGLYPRNDSKRMRLKLDEKMVSGRHIVATALHEPPPLCPGLDIRWQRQKATGAARCVPVTAWVSPICADQVKLNVRTVKRLQASFVRECIYGTLRNFV